MRERIITALILFTIIVFIVFFMPSLFVPLVAITLGIATWEWCRISQLKKRDNYLVATTTIFLWILGSTYSSVFTLLLILSFLHYLYAVYLIYQYEKIGNFRIHKQYLVFVGPIILSALSSSFVYLFHPDNGSPASEEAMSLIFILMIIAATDSGAYFTGRFFGKNKLAPKVSPKKTIEGLIGGLFSVIIVVLLFNFMVEDWYLSTLSLLLIAIITAIFSVVGDLFISIIKRQNGVKDASKILPGHGGVLDRIDGLLSGIPVFYLLQQLF